MDSVLAEARNVFAQLNTVPEELTFAMTQLTRWCLDDEFLSYRPQIRAMAQNQRWGQLYDAFVQHVRFGTGGLRGPVGLGPNRLNRYTTARTVQGHCAYLRAQVGASVRPKVVIAYDVRAFKDFRQAYISGVETPFFGLTSRHLAECAAEVYAANGIDVLIQQRSDGRFMSTPELSHAVRYCGADGGLNISASHNPPDDNGLKFYNHLGGQFVPPNDARLTQYVMAVDAVRRMDWSEAVSESRVQWLPKAAYTQYISLIARQCKRVPYDVPIVFTGLHGAGTWSVPPSLRAAGFTVHEVPEQRTADGAFTTVPGRAPNPEIPACMELATECAQDVGSGIVLATDPDADRIGAAVFHRNQWRYLTGNEIASLVVYQALRKHPDPAHALVMKTEVTTQLVSLIARSFGAKVVDNLLVGFKYIGDGLRQFDETGRFAGVHADVQEFCIGVEESHGILTTPEIRDKDAAGGALLLVECARDASQSGQTLIDVLDDLRAQYGVVVNQLTSTVMQGAVGRTRIQDLMTSLRQSPPSHIGGTAVVHWTDHQDEAGLWGPFKSDTDKASRNVLVFHLKDDARIIIRPSGTEPKFKVYGECLGDDAETVSGRLVSIMEQFLDEVLSRVGLSMASWGHSLSDQLTIEAKCAFVAHVFPRLISDAQEGRVWTSDELNAELMSIGISDVRWVRTGVQRWITQHRALPTEVCSLLGL